MKIVITGGTGAMAKPGILYFLDQSDVKEILITGRTKKKVDEAVAWFKNDRVKGMVLDLMDIEACAKAFEGADVVYNAAYLSTCLSVTTAALKAGANYVDLGGNSHWDQMKMHDDFIKIGKTAVLGLGTAPGMSAMMPAVVIENMDSVDTIEIKDICKNMVPHSEHSRPLHWGYSLEGILDEVSMDAPILIDGKVEWHPARSFKEYVEFLPPAGGGKVGITIHPEVEMFVHSWTKKGLKNASWKIGFEEDFEQKLRFLASLGLAHPDNKIVYNGQEICPRDVV
ncbi:MAG: saccharopine dehydrogenase family protein, partial [Christensenellales bacterium]